MKQIAEIVLPEVTDDRFGAVDPLDGRYFDPEIAQYLSERTRIAYQAYMEGALAQALASEAVCSQAIADEIQAAAVNVRAEDIAEHEKVTRHDVKAVVNGIKDLISDEAKPFVHFGATSYDIVASASALQFRDTLHKLIIPRLDILQKVLLDLTERYADTTQIGRTHGQHAVPITFGFAMAEYVERLGVNIESLRSLASELRGKFSGAVGAYNALSVFVSDPIEFEDKVLGSVGLKPAPYSTQVVPPEYLIRIVDELVISAGIMANLSHDMRHLQRTEIGEVREKFEKGQTGSSTMAHKKNPWNFENVISMSKQVTAQIINANLNLSSEHQRDLTDSASVRFYTVAFASVGSMAARLANVMSKIEVDEEAMQKNLIMTGGAIAAEPLYLLLEKHGHTAAHEAAKEIAHMALEKKLSLAEVAKTDSQIGDYWAKFTDTEKQLIISPELTYTGAATKKAHEISQRWRSR
jgi:adenylosuccinate lyase